MYESNGSSGTITSNPAWQATATIRAQPQSPDALANLGKASQEYAEAANAYIAARDTLNDVRGRWNECRDAVAKLAEAEGI